jgi:hypothetical protein
MSIWQKSLCNHLVPFFFFNSIGQKCFSQERYDSVQKYYAKGR